MIEPSVLSCTWADYISSGNRESCFCDRQGLSVDGLATVCTCLASVDRAGALWDGRVFDRL
jgi:hypothetical protein